MPTASSEQRSEKQQEGSSYLKDCTFGRYIGIALGRPLFNAKWNDYSKKYLFQCTYKHTPDYCCKMVFENCEPGLLTSSALPGHTQLHSSSYIHVAIRPITYFVSFRKPRPVSQLVAQQVNQQFAPPTHPKKDKKEKSEKDKSDKEPTLKRKSHKKLR